MKLSGLAGCAIGIFLLPGYAMTPPKTMTVEQLFKNAETSEDGRVSRTE